MWEYKNKVKNIVQLTLFSRKKIYVNTDNYNSFTLDAMLFIVALIDNQTR